MLRLRTADGLDMASFSASFGPEAASAVHAALGEHIRRGLVHEMPRLPVLSDDDDDEGIKALGHDGDRQIRDEEWDLRVRLSDPDGFLLSNSIISDVFAAFSFKSNATQ
jgi:oxygen-independent coproporphyrinogen-3 oxidase